MAKGKRTRGTFEVEDDGVARIYVGGKKVATSGENVYFPHEETGNVTIETEPAGRYGEKIVSVEFTTGRAKGQHLGADRLDF